MGRTSCTAPTSTAALAALPRARSGHHAVADRAQRHRALRLAVLHPQPRAFRTFWDTTGYVGRRLQLHLPHAAHVVPVDLRLGRRRRAGHAQASWIRSTAGATCSPIRSTTRSPRTSTTTASAAIGMTMAFYDAVINQPASFRTTRRSSTRSTATSSASASSSTSCSRRSRSWTCRTSMTTTPTSTYVVDVRRALRRRRTTRSRSACSTTCSARTYDTFPWFKYYALNIFASVTNTNLIDKDPAEGPHRHPRYETARASRKSMARRHRRPSARRRQPGADLRAPARSGVHVPGRSRLAPRVGPLA
jgi:hypothetical protein